MIDMDGIIKIVRLLMGTTPKREIPTWDGKKLIQ